MGNEQSGQERGAEDAVLVESFKAGSEQAFNELVARHSAKMYQLAYGMLGNKEDAEEVAQDAFVKVYKNIGQFRGDASFSTWLYRITANLARNRYHWNKRRGSQVNVSAHLEAVGDEAARDIEMPDSSKSPEALIQEEELKADIMGGMRRLPDKLREIMTLRHVEDMRYERIAEILDCKIGTVKSRLARARESLKEMVGL